MEADLAGLRAGAVPKPGVGLSVEPGDEALYKRGQLERGGLTSFVVQLPLIPENAGIESLREAAAGCKACDLWEKATQTVFGEGRAHARLMLVGEQPGDREDIEGHPFVGPAGRILDEALEAAGDSTVGRVPHQRGEALSLGAARQAAPSHRNRARSTCARAGHGCSPSSKPCGRDCMVLLGATAAQSVMGTTFKVTQQRGKVLDSPLGVAGARHRPPLVDPQVGGRRARRAAAMHSLDRRPQDRGDATGAERAQARPGLVGTAVTIAALACWPLTARDRAGDGFGCVVADVRHDLRLAGADDRLGR